MLDFIRIACAVPAVRVGDVKKNTQDICDYIVQADEKNADIVVFPEMALTGYTCQDLFFQDTLYEGVKQGLREIVCCSKSHPGVTAVVGLPVRMGMQMFNCATVISGGEVQGFVPKTYIPNYNEFYEKRWFSSGTELTEHSIDVGTLLGREPQFVPIFSHSVFRIGDGTLVGIEICEDLWTPLPPSTMLALSGAEVILNLSASNETIGKSAYRRDLVKHQSAALNAVYAYCSAGSTESTQDLIFSGQSLVALFWPRQASPLHRTTCSFRTATWASSGRTAGRTRALRTRPTSSPSTGRRSSIPLRPLCGGTAAFTRCRSCPLSPPASRIEPSAAWRFFTCRWRA